MLWREPVKLGPVKRTALEAGQLAAPAWIAVSAVLRSDVGAMPSWAPIVAVCCVITSASCILIRFILGLVGFPGARFIQAELESIAEEVWSKPVDELSGPNHHHRVTLFQLRKRRISFLSPNPRWTHNLVPRARHPMAGQRPRRKFRVNHHHPDRCEGVAGMIFCHGLVRTDCLPDLHAKHAKLEQAIRDYASKTCDQVSQVTKERYYARVLGGFTIPARDGSRWGVIVFDSSDCSAIKEDILDLDSPLVRRELTKLPQILSE